MIKIHVLLFAVLLALALVGCSDDSGTNAPPDVTDPTVLTTYPGNWDSDISINSIISASFSEAMDAATIIPATFTLTSGSGPVLGVVTYDSPNKKANFAPSSNLAAGTHYTATITTGAKDIAGNTIAVNKVWSFTTAAVGTGPAPVSLGSAGNYVILAKSAISTVPASVITGDIGLSPAAESYMTGFSQTKATGYSTSPQVVGFMYAADMTPPTPAYMTTAISDMEAAYTDAAGRTLPNHTELNSGNLGGLNLAPGLYKWSSDVIVPASMTITGGANDVWIFQISGTLSASSDVQVILAGGAKAKNIFWQVAGAVTLGTGSHFEGVILTQTAATLNTGASMNGRILAQTQVALDQASITKPAQ